MAAAAAVPGTGRGDRVAPGAAGLAWLSAHRCRARAGRPHRRAARDRRRHRGRRGRGRGRDRAGATGAGTAGAGAGARRGPGAPFARNTGIAPAASSSSRTRRTAGSPARTASAITRLDRIGSRTRAAMMRTRPARHRCDCASVVTGRGRAPSRQEGHSRSGPERIVNGQPAVRHLARRAGVTVPIIRFPLPSPRGHQLVPGQAGDDAGEAVQVRHRPGRPRPAGRQHRAPPARDHGVVLVGPGRVPGPASGGSPARPVTQ